MFERKTETVSLFMIVNHNASSLFCRGSQVETSVFLNLAWYFSVEIFQKQTRNFAIVLLLVVINWDAYFYFGSGSSKEEPFNLAWSFLRYILCTFSRKYRQIVKEAHLEHFVTHLSCIGDVITALNFYLFFQVTYFTVVHAHCNSLQVNNLSKLYDGVNYLCSRYY